MVQRYYVPASSHAAAEAFVSGIELGRIPALPEYLDPILAAENYEAYPRGMGYRLWCVERRASDDGWIWVARLVARIGSLAAAFLIVIGGAYATGIGSLI